MSDEFPLVRPLQELKAHIAEWNEGAAGRWLRGRAAVLSFVESLGGDLTEDCLAIFVADDLRLLASYAVARSSSGALPAGELIAEGKRLGAAGFLLVEPKSDPGRTLDHRLLAETGQLRSLTRELDFPLLDYLIIDGNEVLSAGGIRTAALEKLH